MPIVGCYKSLVIYRVRYFLQWCFPGRHVRYLPLQDMLWRYLYQHIKLDIHMYHLWAASALWYWIGLLFHNNTFDLSLVNTFFIKNKIWNLMLRLCVSFIIWDLKSWKKICKKLVWYLPIIWLVFPLDILSSDWFQDSKSTRIT